MKRRITLWVVAGAAVLFAVLLGIWLSVYSELLWFSSLGYASVFWIALRAKVFTFLVFCLLFFFITWSNVRAAYRLSPRPEETGFFKDLNIVDLVARSRLINWGWTSALLVLALMVGGAAVSKWDLILRFVNRIPFGSSEPIFGRDAGFYVFTLPFLKFIQQWLFNTLFFSLVVTGIVYGQEKAIMVLGGQVRISRATRSHMSFLGGFIFLFLAWNIRLRMFELLYSSRGVVHGTSYTDHHAQIPAYWILTLAALACSIALFVNVKKRGWRLPAWSIGGLVGLAIVAGAIYPGLVQQIVVKPNEITKERPYILNNIKATTDAFGLTDVDMVPFEVSGLLGYEDVARNSGTISNIRLWDPRPLTQTYRQIQEIRLYYNFMSVDEDRYTIDGKYTHVMLSPREMSTRKLPKQAQTWVNNRLKYTHGYGLCLSPVAELTSEGLPVLLVQDIPPESRAGIKVDRPEIYFGESTDDYCIVRTREEEFDYPLGDENVYTTYEGSGGVPIGSGFRRLAYAWRFRDLKILLTRYITTESRIMFHRLTKVRLRTIVPFLSYDRDPYVVVVDGKLFWMADAYTTTSTYPYSEPFGGRVRGINYIRNSVKAVIDAYSGKTTFYLIDESDPIAGVYRKIFPNLFRPIDEMPAGLKEHIRYPRDLFLIQVEVYSKYHMEDPQVFYNQEDLWALPHQTYEGNEIVMRPYYVIIKLPGKERAEYRMMVPVTPANRSNMIAWMSATCDFPEYGKLMVYQFPKKKLVYGPMQIEARIDQDADISKEMTLWGQKGSRVIRGDLLVIPIEQSIAYVEPVYLQATKGELPQLKRVIVAHGDQIVMGSTLNESLSHVFGGRVALEAAPRVEKVAGLKSLVGDALNALRAAKRSLSSWEWGEFGREIDRLEAILRDMDETVPRD
jgi:uncharacterized membrane protein (UPF0182 family)